MFVTPASIEFLNPLVFAHHAVFCALVKFQALSARYEMTLVLLSDKNEVTEDRNPAEEDKEREIPRYSVDHEFNQKEQMSWKFYSANEDDYKITAQDEESNGLQTPISDEQESGDKSAVRKSELDEPKSATIKPVQGVISPVLENPDGLRVSGCFLIHPEIQASSIWKPRASPLSHPNAQPDENDTTKNDGKSHEVPLDLTVRDQVKPQEVPVCCTKSNSTTAIKNKQQLSLSSSAEEDMSDEESFSNLAAFCQAKVSALYAGMPPDDETTYNDDVNRIERPKFIEVKDKVIMREKMIRILHKDKMTSSADTEKSVVHYIRLDPSPHKKIKLTKPSKIKIDLSMPLCSPEAPYTISKSKDEVTKRESPHQAPNHLVASVGIGDHDSFTTGTESSADFKQTRKLHVSKVIPNSKIECEEMPTVETEKTGMNTNPSDESTSEEASQQSRSASPMEVEKSAGSLTVSTSGEINGSSFLHDVPPTTNPQRVFSVQGFKVLQSANMYSVLLPKADPIPVTFMQNISSPVGFSPGEKYTQNEYFSVSNSPSQAFSQPAGKPDQSEIKPNQQTNDASATGTESAQKLPSIDQIFRPLNKTSLVTPPAVAANVEISGTSENSQVPLRTNNEDMQISQPVSMAVNATRHEHASTSAKSRLAYRDNTKNKSARQNKGNRASIKSMSCRSQQSPDTGWNGLSAANHLPDMYPCPPSHPSYARWSSPFPWPHYFPMTGRCPPYFPSPIPTYNPYAK